MKNKIHVKGKYCAGQNCDYKPTHTPTPWFQKGQDVFLYRGVFEYPDKIARCTGELDAAFIVKAVNSHEELLRQLKSLHDLFHRCAGGSCSTYKTIARAEGK